MKQPTLEEIAQIMRANDMKVFTKPNDMTLGGIRTKDNKANTFNDWLFMMYHKQDGRLVGIVRPGTTDAGLYYRENPMHPDGTAIIMHGVQHRGAYEYQNPPVDGKRGHRNQEGFRQIAKMKYWRDADRDQYLDFDGEEQEDIFYTNGHDMGTLGRNVNKWSAGCWGSTNKIMDEFYALARRQIGTGYGSKFSFAMLHEDMFTES